MKKNSNRGSAKLPQNPRKKQPRTRASGGSKPINPDRAAAGDGLVSALRAAMGEELLWGVRAAAQAAAMPLPAYILEAAEVYSDHDQARRKAFPDGSGLTLSLTISRDLHARLVEASRLQGIGVDVLASRALSGAVAVVEKPNPTTETSQDRTAHPFWLGLEHGIKEASGMVALLGGALSGDYQTSGMARGDSMGCGVNTLAMNIAHELLAGFNAAVDEQRAGKDTTEKDAALRLSLNEAAAFSHAACVALADRVGFSHPEWRQMREAYAALASRSSVDILRTLTASEMDVSTAPALRPSVAA